MMYLIIGRTASGKDYLANILEKQHGFECVKSRTTRPKRDENDESHIFVTKEQADADADKRVAHTVINGNDYYVLPEDIEDKNLYIIDPKGAIELMNNMPDEVFSIIYVKADKELRKTHYIKRQKSDDFDERDASEDSMFSDFETIFDDLDKHEYNDISNNKVFDMHKMPDNIHSLHLFNNTYTETSINTFADKIGHNKRIFDFVLTAVSNVIDNKDNYNLENIYKDGKFLIKDDTNSDTYVSINLYVAALMCPNNAEMFQSMIMANL